MPSSRALLIWTGLLLAAESHIHAQDLRPRNGQSGGSEAAQEQEEDRIETDRDSFTPATTTAGYGRLIVESAYSFIDNRDVLETHSYPELLGRYGVTEGLELRLGYNFEVGGGGNDISSSGVEDRREQAELEREHDVSYGLKRVLTDQDGWTPQSAIIVQGATPVSGATATQLAATYVVGWELPNGWNWDSSIRYGIGSAEGDRFNAWAPSSVLKIPIADRWNAHVEYFGVFSSGRESEVARHFFSPGLHYLLTDDVEIGVRVGWGLNQQAANFFSNAGVGLRF